MSVNPGDVIAYTIGAGGKAGAAVGASSGSNPTAGNGGATGGDSIFGSLTAAGGTGGSGAGEPTGAGGGGGPGAAGAIGGSPALTASSAELVATEAVTPSGPEVLAAGDLPSRVMQPAGVPEAQVLEVAAVALSTNSYPAVRRYQVIPV